MRRSMAICLAPTLGGLPLPPPRSFFSEVERAALRAVHVEAADAGQLHDLGGGHAADHHVACVAAGQQVRQHRPSRGLP